MRILLASCASALLISACSTQPTALPPPSLFPSEMEQTGKVYENATDLRLGRGVPRDYAEASRLLRQLAEEGDGRAMNDLGVMVARGQGYDRDYSEAARWFSRAAANGNSSARFNLALMQLHGLGVANDLDQAISLLFEAAYQGNPRAQVLLAQVLEFHGGSSSEVRRLRQRAAESGDIEAWRDLAAADGDAWASVADPAVDSQDAVSDLLAADHAPALEGYPLARLQDELANLRREASAGVMVAQHNLALRYANGDGVPHDNGEAARWMTRAADAGYAPAQYQLARMYLNGQGVQQDPVVAHLWFNRASSARDANLARAARRSLEDLEAQMPPRDINRAQSMAADRVRD